MMKRFRKGSAHVQLTLDMEIKTLRYLLAVAREENMTRAAQILHVTQPTLSKQLKALEEELGKKLPSGLFPVKLSELKGCFDDQN